jgi:hypothetical protein
MTDDTRPRLPAALILGLALELLSTLLYVVIVVAKRDPFGTRFQLTNEGIGIASDALMMSGAFVLARTLTGPAASGARLVAGLLAARLAIVVAWAAMDCYLFTGHEASIPESIYTVMQWVHAGIAIGIVLGWILAAGGFAMRAPLAIPALLLAAVAHAPRMLAEPLTDLFGKSAIVFPLIHVALAGLVIALAITATRDARAVAAPEAAAAGLRAASSALWLRVIAAISIVGLSLLLVGGGGSHGQGLLKVVLLVGQLVNVSALAWFGFGALKIAGSEAPDLPRYQFAIGGALSLWSASVMLVQTPWLCEMLFGRGSFGAESARMLEIATPLVAAAGVLFVVIGISGAASRRGLSEVSERAGSRGAAFVALTLANILLQTLVLPAVSTMPGFVLATLAIAVAGFVAIVQIAKLCSSAADQLDLEPGLPRAIVRISDQP